MQKFHHMIITNILPVLFFSESEAILPLPTTVRPVASSSSQEFEMHMIPRQSGEHCQIANVNTTVSRNPLSDMNLFAHANITGGTFTINVMNKE